MMPVRKCRHIHIPTCVQRSVFAIKTSMCIHDTQLILGRLINPKTHIPRLQCWCSSRLPAARQRQRYATQAVAGVALVSENAPLDMKQFVFLFGNDDFSVLTTASTPTQTSPSPPRGRPKNSPCLPTTSPTAFTSRASTSATSAARFVRTEFAY